VNHTCALQLTLDMMRLEISLSSRAVLEWDAAEPVGPSAVYALLQILGTCAACAPAVAAVTLASAWQHRQWSHCWARMFSASPGLPTDASPDPQGRVFYVSKQGQADMHFYCCTQNDSQPGSALCHTANMDTLCQQGCATAHRPHPAALVPCNPRASIVCVCFRVIHASHGSSDRLLRITRNCACS
jgi:hypothetical protein